MEFYVKLDASDAVWKPLILIKYDEADFILKKTYITICGVHKIIRCSIHFCGVSCFSIVSCMCIVL